MNEGIKMPLEPPAPSPLPSRMPRPEHIGPFCPVRAATGLAGGRVPSPSACSPSPRPPREGGDDVIFSSCSRHRRVRFSTLSPAGCDSLCPRPWQGDAGLGPEPRLRGWQTPPPTMAASERLLATWQWRDGASRPQVPPTEPREPREPQGRRRTGVGGRTHRDKGPATS